MWRSIPVALCLLFVAGCSITTHSSVPATGFAADVREVEPERRVLQPAKPRRHAHVAAKPRDHVAAKPREPMPRRPSAPTGWTDPRESTERPRPSAAKPGPLEKEHARREKTALRDRS